MEQTIQGAQGIQEKKRALQRSKSRQIGEPVNPRAMGQASAIPAELTIPRQGINVHDARTVRRFGTGRIHLELFSRHLEHSFGGIASVQSTARALPGPGCGKRRSLVPSTGRLDQTPAPARTRVPTIRRIVQDTAGEVRELEGSRIRRRCSRYQQAAQGVVEANLLVRRRHFRNLIKRSEDEFLFPDEPTRRGHGKAIRYVVYRTIRPAYDT